MVAHVNVSVAPPLAAEDRRDAAQSLCALCGLAAHRDISATYNNEELAFCCYACQHIYDVVSPNLAAGVALPVALGQSGLDLNAPCCRGIIYGDPVEEADKTLSRLMLNAFLAMMVMALSLALYSDFFFADWGEAGAGARSMLQTLAMLFATPAVLLLALPILEDAVFTFQIKRQLTASALIAIGSLAAYGLSVYAVFTGNGHTYFETAVMTLLLVTLGRWLDLRAQIESAKALDNLLARTPTEASLLTAGGEEVRTPFSALRVGDRIRVRPGENFAVDGSVVSGEGSVDEATITGESQPAYKGPGCAVYAGATSQDGSFVVEAAQVGEDRVVGKLIRLLDEARLYRAPIERLADRIAAYFVPTVVALASITFIYWAWQVDFETGLLTALAVLLIACPCALGIATPLAIWAALGRAAQDGILIRSSLALEKLSRVKQIFFDKTGTLTTGQPTLLHTAIAETRPGMTENNLLQLAASLESLSEHPLAKAVTAAAKQTNLPFLPASEFQALPGLGVSGKIDGHAIILGSWRMIENKGLSLPADLEAARREFEASGLTVVYIGDDDRVWGLMAFTETIRPGAEVVLANMRENGLNVQVLTGDSQAAGNALAARLGVTVQSQLLPHDKVAVIERAERETPVAMVGDGLNDAPALARASVGVAMGCGADVTRETADVSLLGSDLAQIGWTFSLARHTYRIIGGNLTWAFAYNVVGVALAMTGQLHPVIAAGAMVLSSAIVVVNSLRIFRY